jgi:hypothetical protein
VRKNTGYARFSAENEIDTPEQCPGHAPEKADAHPPGQAKQEPEKEQDQGEMAGPQGVVGIAVIEMIAQPVDEKESQGDKRKNTKHGYPPVFG